MDIGRAIASAPYTSKQRRTAAAIFFGVATALTAVADPRVLQTIVAAAEGFPKTLSEVAIRSALRHPQGRRVVEHCLGEGAITGNVAAYAVRKLNESPREKGLNVMPELYA